MLHLADIGPRPARVRAAAATLETIRADMFTRLDYHSRVRLRVWHDGSLVYNSAPSLPDVLPAVGSRTISIGSLKRL